ncbi:glutamyl aminopeptidase-like [Teleopsis dalmanni]|uniref:glutamyl aminopeptidase-like n=1 Tax=Teleopsis dalmanni TaxID=139649 RepID=UPI0018CF226A|nr:glutamyl aminopeptidase-like [Teleopsis dalmanni]
MKATFEIVLVRPTEDGYHALSNMNELKSVAMGKYTETYFAKSVAMSTYVACFIVSDFAHKTERIDTKGIGDNFDIRVFATAHQLNKVDFALTTAVAITEFYISYFKVPYPLPKLDMAAIPDFVSNAMEHWGLVTYRETALLYDSSYSSTWNKQRVAVVVAHELAHMWFGNLVTMMWWNDLWLNEGFARYMEYKGVNEVYPEWGMLNQFLIHALHSVMAYDSSVASHPIIQTVETPDQITEIFDTISYEKGASVIRMLEDVTGEKFEAAVTSYLTHFKFLNAITGDFIRELELQELDFDVELFMRTWTEQMGFPVVEVIRTTPTTFRLTQKRFFSNIEDYNAIYNDSVFNYTWSIPLTYYTDLDSSTIERRWFNHDESIVEIMVDPEIKWIKINVNQVGFYRVNYADNTWHEIIAHLTATPETFSIADRAHLLNDVFALADANQLSYDIALDMTKYLEKENDFVPWYVAATKLQSLQVSLRYTDAYIDYLAYARNLLDKIYSQVTWEVKEEDHLNNRLRVSVLTAACSLGVPDCLNEAATRFTSWLAIPEDKPHPDLREIVYYYGMQQIGKQEHWDKMLEIYLKEQDASEKIKLMYGLSAVRIPWLLYSFIELAEQEKYVRRQDYFTCLQNIATNPIGTPIVWEFVRENWSKLVDRFGLNERYLGRMIPSITQTFDTETKLEEMSEFFNKYPEAGAGAASRKQALETVKYNIKWLAENKDKVATWLNSQR